MHSLHARWAVLVTALFLWPLSSGATSLPQLVLYDVTADGLAVGSDLPASSGSSFPHTLPTVSGFPVPTNPLVLVKAPTIVASSGPLTDQPIEFTQSGLGAGTQIQFQLGDALAGLDPQYDKYTLDVDVVLHSLGEEIGSTHGFRVLFDLPGTFHSLDFGASGEMAYSAAGMISSAPIGSFGFGQAFQLHAVVDLAAQNLTILKDGALLLSGPIAGNDLRWIRFGLNDASGGVALDNIRITAVPEPSTALMLSLGLVALAGTRPRRVRR